MLKENKIEIINRDCPFCDKVHDIEHRFELAEMVIKDEKVEYVAEFYLCPVTKCEDGNSWTAAGMLDENLFRAKDAYRVNHSLLKSDDIKNIRKKYGLTQKELSNLLGLGNITISRYETTHIQDEIYDNALRAVMNNSSLALEELIKHKNLFSGERFSELKEMFKSMIKEEGNADLKRQEIRNHYIDHDTESDENGFKLLNIGKVADVIAYFANYVKNLYKVKLMKLLWYSDVLYFNKYGNSMMGLVYSHKPLGALPLAHGEIIYLPTVDVIEEETEFGTSYNIVPLKHPINPIFSLEEQEILTKVASRFKDINGKDISDYMHKETAYKNTVDGEIILYSKTSDIAYF